MMRARVFAIFGLFALCGTFLFHRTEARTAWQDSSERDKVPDFGAIPLPSGAIELKREYHFPDATEGPFLSQPVGFIVVPDGRFYVPDQRNDQVAVFKMQGKFLISFGQTGQGPGDLLRPAGITFFKERIIVREAGNMRFQFFDLSGKYMDGFRASRVYTDFVTCEDYLLATPFLPTEATSLEGLKLIDVLDLRGRIIRSFGYPLEVNRHDLPWLNSAILLRGRNGELWVAFRFFPIIRRYGLNGEILAEYRYSSAIVSAKEALNKRRDAERAAGGSLPYYGYVAHSGWATDRGLYLIDSAAGNRLVITFVNSDGRIEESYWAPIEPKGFSCMGLFVREDGGNKKFFVLDASEACVSVYSVH